MYTSVNIAGRKIPASVGFVDNSDFGRKMGITQHNSRCAIEDCVTYNVCGAGFVSELGNNGFWIDVAVTNVGTPFDNTKTYTSSVETHPWKDLMGLWTITNQTPKPWLYGKSSDLEQHRERQPCHSCLSLSQSSDWAGRSETFWRSHAID